MWFAEISRSPRSPERRRQRSATGRPITPRSFARDLEIGPGRASCSKTAEGACCCQFDSMPAYHGIARENGAYYPVIMRTISVKLPDDLLAELAREAKARRVTKSSLVRESLEKGLPKDLADNPKFMEGFGQ